MKILGLKMKRRRFALTLLDRGYSFNLPGSQQPDLNTIIKEKIVHLIPNDKFTTPFVDFLNSNFNDNNHIVICYGDSKFPLPQGDNVYVVTDLNYKLSNARAIICHSLFTKEIIKKLYYEPTLLAKSYWAVWGGDLYDVKSDKKGDFVRGNFSGYITFDREELYKKYQIAAPIYKMIYPLPTNLEMLDKAVEEKKLDPVLHVQINNSSCNSTIEMLGILNKFNKEKIKISTIMSYGKTHYNGEISTAGECAFNEKFVAMRDYLAPQDYAAHLASVNVLVFNQPRQQGLGNIYAALYLGSKVFIRKEISTYSFFEQLGFHIHNTHEIRTMSIDAFKSASPAEQNTNRALAKKLLDGSMAREAWSEIFTNIYLG